MNKKKKWGILLGCLSALCLLASACTAKGKDDEMAERGYMVSVTYDAGSGRFFSRDGVTLKDYVNPNTFDKDGDGVAEIKLLAPEDPSRKASVGKTGHFLAGWYASRELVLSEDGKIVDANGKELEELSDGTWIVKGTKDTASYPVYQYSDPWDFENDRLMYDPNKLTETDGKLSLTLYAGWVPYYEFHYYYMENGQWTKKATTSFDYDRNLKMGGDKNTIWTPDWKDGAMNYQHAYADNSSQYSFPKQDGTTFLKAYTDENKQNEINGSFVHQGALDRDNCTAINPVQNVYVTVEEGERYRISTANQLVDTANADGYYEIYADLDFTGLSWPGVFSLTEFNGKFYTASNVASVTLSNISATLSSSVTYGGLFGKLGDKAVLENVKFENVTIDFNGVSGFSGKFGLFAGDISEQATLSGVSVGGTLKIGDFNNYGFTMNAVANGDQTGLTHTSITVLFYGQAMDESYVRYSYDPSTRAIDSETGAITFTIGLMLEQGLALEYQEIYN